MADRQQQQPIRDTAIRPGTRTSPRDRSGNPKGRPKGSQNLAAILAKAGRQRIKVTENGRTRYITKFEAIMLQLVNKAVSGDLKAIHVLQLWIIAWKSRTNCRLPICAT